MDWTAAGVATIQEQGIQIDWAAAGVVVALAFNVINFIWGIFLPWRRKGRASIEVRHVDYRLPTAGGLTMVQADYLVIVNHGPGRARQVDVIEIIDTNGGAMREDARFNWHLPVGVLHAGQEYHLQLTMSAADANPAQVKVSWTDARPGCQEEEFWVSPQVRT